MVNPIWLKDKKPVDPVALWKDAGLSAASGLRSGVESLAGAGGDIADLMDMGANYGITKLGGDPTDYDYSKYDPLHWLPSSEDVGEVTDALVNKLPSSVADPFQDITRHEATTPGGSLLNTVVQTSMDPDLIGVTAGRKLLQKGGREGLTRLLRGANDAAPAATDIEHTMMHDPQAFYDAVKAAKDEHWLGPAVELKQPEDYADTKKFLSPDAASGFAIKPDGDLVSVFSTKRDRLTDILNTATRWGANKLDAFDLSTSMPGQKGLPETYKKYGGFHETGRAPWNPEYAPPDWEPFMGEPDVAWMQRTPPRADRTYYGEPDWNRFNRPAPTREVSR